MEEIYAPGREGELPGQEHEFLMGSEGPENEQDPRVEQFSAESNRACGSRLPTDGVVVLFVLFVEPGL